jgi:hypothetical protein
MVMVAAAAVELRFIVTARCRKAYLERLHMTHDLLEVVSTSVCLHCVVLYVLFASAICLGIGCAPNATARERESALNEESWRRLSPNSDVNNDAHDAFTPLTVTTTWRLAPMSSSSF